MFPRLLYFQSIYHFCQTIPRLQVLRLVLACLKDLQSARTKSLPENFLHPLISSYQKTDISCNLSQLFVFSTMVMKWEEKIALDFWIFRDYYCVTSTIACVNTISGPIHQTPDFLQTLKCFPSYCLLRLEELHKPLLIKTFF